MTVKLFLALLCGKIVYFLGKRFGKATNLPGEWALRICPDFLSRVRFRGKVLAVTGSNGKTTTANLVAHILKQQGYTVANNAKGSNLLGGAATTILHSADFHGVVHEDFVVLEVDERFSRLIFRDFSPDFLLVTNLFRDQLTRNGNVDVIISKLHEAIGPGVKLVLNGNDPISGLLAPENGRVYYAMEETPLSTPTCVSLTHDARVCPRCLARIDYTFYHYNHIGSFACTRCGWETPAAEYTAAGVDFQTGDFTVNGCPVNNSYRCAFHFLNVTAAIALCCEAGVPLEKACAAASSFQVSRQRYDEFQVGGRRALMILSKNQNPVSFDQSISYLLDLPGRKTVIAYINNINHTGEHDTTWLYDIAFERLVNEVDYIVCTGPRAYDLAVRLRLAGFSEELVRIQPDVKALGPAVAGTSGTICILTELYDAKAIREVLRK